MPAAPANRRGGFHPNDSKVGDSARHAFLTSRLEEDLTTVPGIAGRNAAILARAVKDERPITSTYQLLGKFLTLKRANLSQEQHINDMWCWLQSRDVNAHRAGIVLCVAEKLNMMVPGLFDAASWDDSQVISETRLTEAPTVKGAEGDSGEGGFNPSNSQMRDEAVRDFRAARVSEDLTTVPGIGPATQKQLRRAGVTTTYQLLGVFLMLKGQGVSQRDHCNSMCFWLQKHGVSAFRAGIVHCLAEKINIMIPGIYDAEEWNVAPSRTTQRSPTTLSPPIPTDQKEPALEPSPTSDKDSQPHSLGPAILASAPIPTDRKEDVLAPSPTSDKDIQPESFGPVMLAMFVAFILRYLFI